MMAEKARKISHYARETKRLEKIHKKKATLVRLRKHPEYRVGRGVASVEAALQAIEKSALSGQTGANCHVRREGRPPGAVEAAKALGESEAVAEKLRGLGYHVEVGFPYQTHDYGGHNGVLIAVWVGWEESCPS